MLSPLAARVRKISLSETVEVEVEADFQTDVQMPLVKMEPLNLDLDPGRVQA